MRYDPEGEAAATATKDIQRKFWEPIEGATRGVRCTQIDCGVWDELCKAGAQAFPGSQVGGSNLCPANPRGKTFSHTGHQAWSSGNATQEARVHQPETQGWWCLAGDLGGGKLI